jgi:hypothetical protein
VRIRLGKILTLSFIIFLLLSLFLPLKPASASLIFSDGFESGTFSLWDLTLGNCQVSTILPYSGAYSARFWTDTGQSALIEKDFTPTNISTATFWHYYDALPNPSLITGSIVSMFLGTTAVNLAMLGIKYNTGLLRWYYQVWETDHYTPSRSGYSSFNVTTGIWLNITEQIKVGSGTGWYQCYINNVLTVNETSLNNISIGNCDRFQIRSSRSGGSGTIVSYQDDVRIGQSYADVLLPVAETFTMFCTGNPVNSEFTVNGAQYLTPINITKVKGEYTLATPDSIIDSGTTYHFMYWLVNATEYHTTWITVNFTGNATVVIYRIQQGAPNYILNGGYSELGFPDGTVNITCYRSDQSPFNFLLSHQYNLSVTSRPISFVFHLVAGTNETRNYYLMADYETIYVFVPSQPYYTYFFTVIDYVGIKYGYLESLLNINGTDRVIERWTLSTLNDLPFTMSWGTAYKLRLICNLGTYYYPSFVAGATTTQRLTITSDMFPSVGTNRAGFTVTAERKNATWVQVSYFDSNSTTTWVYTAIYELGTNNIMYSTNLTTNSVVLNWYDGDIYMNYWVYVVSLSTKSGYNYWYLSCPYQMPAQNPWSQLDTAMGTIELSNGIQIYPSQLLGLAILMCFFLAFSEKNIPIGLGVGVIVAAILTYIGWLQLSWTFITSALAIAIIIGLAITKDRTPEVEL